MESSFRVWWQTFALLILSTCLVKGSPGSIGGCIECDTPTKPGTPRGATRITEHVTILPVRGPNEAAKPLKDGDEIVEIEGQKLAGIKLEDAFDMLNGEEGTILHLTVRRKGQPELLKLEVACVGPDHLIHSRYDPN